MERMMVGKVKRGDTAPRLDSPKTRAEDCEVRGQPYYRELLNNLHIGYRRGNRRGVWVVRRWLGDAYVVETIALADDAEPASCASASRCRAVSLARSLTCCTAAS
jgi:hypothetical protein